MKTQYTIATILAIAVLSFIVGRMSKQCHQPDPIIRYIEVNKQINTIQNEIDSIDVIINSPTVTIPRSKRDSLRQRFNP